MEIDDKLIAYLEDLSRIRLEQEEKSGIQADLTKILGYTDILNQVETLDVPALSHPFEAVNAYREDVVKPSSDRVEILQNARPAPAEAPEYFKAPKVL